MTLWMSLIAATVRGQGHDLPDLRPPHVELAPTFWEQHGWQVLFAAIILVLVIVLSVILLRRPRRVVPESPAITARRALEQWRDRKEDGALVAEVTRILKRYVISAFHFPSGELTTAEFRRTLQNSPGIKPELATATDDFLRRCDEWKFSATPSVPQLGAVKGALELVDKFEATRSSDGSTLRTPHSALPS